LAFSVISCKNTGAEMPLYFCELIESPLMKFRLFPLFVLLIALHSLSIGQEAEPTTQPGVTIHVVQRGESLYRIAIKYGLAVSQIAEVNGIANTNNIQVGQRILIPLEPAPEILPPTKHTVQPGETLRTISEAYSVDEATLVQLNGITNPDMLYVGQELTIVPETEVLPTLAPEVAQNTEQSVEDAEVIADIRTITTTGLRHTVASGETLFTIAQRYGVTTQELQDANNISNASVIYAGQELVVPGVEPIQDAVQLPAAITGLDLTPLTLREGKTGRIRLTTRAAATVTATFLNSTLPVIALEDGTSFIVWAVAPLGTAAGIYPFTLSIIEGGGEVTEFMFNIQVEAGGYGRVSVSLPGSKAELIGKPVEDNELNILRNVMGQFNAERYFDGPMSLPAAAAMNSPFGTLRAYNGGPFDSYHFGADFAGAAGSAILAASSGRVVLADNLNIRGTSVIIDHGWGVYTVYSHMSERYANIGDFIATGQVIGLVGSSGRAQGPHLHWEIWVNGNPVDPLQWVYQAFP
jgi:murein DD-endopeptidase MepM/ murein hydrolase activator NlpD